MGANCAAALKMPSNYVVMDVDEMTYTEGGGTFTLKMNKEAVKYIAQATGVVSIGAVTAAMGVTGIGAVVSNAVGNLVYQYMLDVLCKDIKDINKSWTAPWLPDQTFEWNK